MSDSDLQTTTLHVLLDRLRGGERAAEDELLRRIQQRVERLCRRMLRAYPRVEKAEDTCDVMQNVLLRLMRSLRELKPASTREFFGLATEQIRRELLDLAKFYGRDRRDLGKVVPLHAPLNDSGPGEDPSHHPDTPANLEVWESFHEAVSALPPEERECVGLIYYHGWTRPEVAELFQVNERTIRRWWVSACLKIKAKLGHDLPEA